MPDKTPAQIAAEQWLNEHSEDFEHWNTPSHGDFAGQSFYGDDDEGHSFTGTDYTERPARSAPTSGGFPTEFHSDENGMLWNEFGEWNTGPAPEDPYYAERLGLADRLNASHDSNLGGVYKRDDHGVLHSITDPENSGTGKWHVNYSIYRGPNTPADEYESDHWTPEEAESQMRLNMNHVHLDKSGWSLDPSQRGRFFRNSTAEPGVSYTLDRTEGAEHPWRLTKLVGGQPVGYRDHDHLQDADYDTHNDVPERSIWRTAFHRRVGSVSRASDTVWR